MNTKRKQKNQALYFTMIVSGVLGLFVFFVLKTGHHMIDHILSIISGIWLVIGIIGYDFSNIKTKRNK